MNKFRRFVKLKPLSVLNISKIHNNSEIIKLKQDKILYTPGPLMTTKTVKQAMQRDIGVGDIEFKEIVCFIQKKLLEIAGVSNEDDNYVTILVQGSGTYSLEAVVQHISDKNSNILIIENGLYGRKLAQICDKSNINYYVKSFPENRSVDLNILENFLKTCKPNQFTTVGFIHSETSSGVLNQAEYIGPLIKNYLPNSTIFIDSISCFGAVEVNLKKSKIDFLICSSNKCIQSVPGVAFIIANKNKLLNNGKNNSKTLSLDIYDQYEVDLRCKLFRFTPPTHVILALKQALIELEECGGPNARYKNIIKNHEIIYNEMTKLGFKSYVPLDEQSKVVNSFLYPNNKNFLFEKFQKKLLERGKVLYSRSLTTIHPTFRIGCIGQLSSNDMYNLIDEIKIVLKELNVDLPVD